MQRIFGREKSGDPRLITPFPWGIVPHIAKGSSGLVHDAAQQTQNPRHHEIESAMAAGILSALDSLSIPDMFAGDGEEYSRCKCKHAYSWDDAVSFRKRRRSPQDGQGDDEDTVTLADTILTSDSITLCEPVIPTTNNPQYVPDLLSLGKREISPEEIMHRLCQEFIPGQDNTRLLLKALEYATPEELETEITRGFYAKCQASQTSISAQILWASAVVELSRPDKSQQSSDIGFHRSEPTTQQRLLKALVQSNQTLLEALEIYRDLENYATGKKEGCALEQDSLSLNSTTSLPRPTTPRPFYKSPPPDGANNSALSGHPNDDPMAKFPRYIRPLPHLPPDNPTPEPTATHIPSRSQSLRSRRERLFPPAGPRPPLPHGPRSTHNRVSKDDTHASKHHVPDMVPSRNRSPFGKHSSYREFSASSPSLRLRFKQGQQLPTDETDPPHDAPGSGPSTSASLSVDDSPYRLFSASSPSLTTPPHIPTEAASSLPISLTANSPAHGALLSTGVVGSSGLLAPLVESNLDLPDLTGKITREGDFPAGRGGYADVWKCVMRLPLDECTVAVKVLQSHLHDSEFENKIAKRIRREIAIWKRLNHENVLPLLGTVEHFGRYISLVSPWMDNGSLVQYLKECGDDMGILRRLQLACEVAAGLTYLHSSGVVHGDLSGMNILITNEGKACLCDFGLSNLMLEFHDPTFYTSTIGANARWAAPEIYRITNDETAPTATTKSDVYSFGCILLEIFSGLIPYHYLARDGQVLLELQHGNKPRRPQEGYVTDVLWDQINTCWADDAAERPTSQHVWEFLARQFYLERQKC